MTPPATHNGSGDESHDHLFTAYAAELIRITAHKLSRRPGFARSDQEDLEQELRLALMKRGHGFDHSRASFNTFVDRVVQSAGTQILRDRNRQKRANGYRAARLDATRSANGTNTTTLAEMVTERDKSRHRGIASRDDITHYVTAEAVKQALESMPEPVRQVCRQVMGGHTISSLARERCTSRRQIRKTLQVARPFLIRAGFGNKTRRTVA